MVLMALEQSDSTQQGLKNHHSIGNSNDQSLFSHWQPDDSIGPTDIRSVAMSANVASSVCEEVNHLIHVASELTMNCANIMSSAQSTNDACNDMDTVCSFVLPTDSIIMAVVLSRWDDIVGPQTVQVWLQKNAEYTSNFSSAGFPSVDKNCKNINSLIMKSVYYVTCHTVNCASVSATSSSTSMLVVPDLNMLTLTCLFHPVSSKVGKIPLSLGVIASLNQYTFFHQRFGVVQSWIERLSHRLLPALVRDEILADSGLEELTPGVLELNDAITSLCLVGLELPSLDLIQGNRNASNHPSMPHALTSHLQTFGCTVVIGMGSQEVNDFIKFLGLFLDDDEKYSSMLIHPCGHNCFHAGLHLQGLLLDAFGYREISSLDLASNLYPVTVIDLSRPVDEGGVKQTHPHHHHLVLQYEGNNQRASMPQADFITNSLLHPVEESSKLICALLLDLSVLPLENWQQHIHYFKTKLLNMTQLFISYMFRISTTFTQKLFQTTIDKFKKSLNLGDADFLLILANCEKIKPGFFSYVTNGSC